MTPLWFSSFTRVRLLQPTSLWTKQALRHTHHWQQRTGQNAIFFKMIIHIIDNHNCSTFSLSLQYTEQNVVVCDILIPKLQLFIGALNESVNSYSYGCQIYVGRSVVVILLPKPSQATIATILQLYQTAAADSNYDWLNLFVGGDECPPWIRLLHGLLLVCHQLFLWVRGRNRGSSWEHYWLCQATVSTFAAFAFENRYGVWQTWVQF